MCIQSINQAPFIYDLCNLRGVLFLSYGFKISQFFSRVEDYLCMHDMLY